MTSIKYIANIRLPTEKAHGLQIMKTCEALAKSGIKVELVVPRRFNYIKNDPFAYYGVKNNFKITKLRCLDLISFGIFDRLGFWTTSWTFYLSVKKYFKLETAELDGDKTIFYTRDLPMAYWLLKHFSPVYYEIHTLPAKITKIYKTVWERCSGLVVISNGLKNKLVEEGANKNKILVARDAVDVDKFNITSSKRESRIKLNLPVDQKIIIYTGHLYKWKGADLLAKVASLIPTDLNVYLVGGVASDVEKFRKFYHAPNLHIIGWQPYDAMPYWLKAADLLVLPNSAQESISALYTSPLKLFEYMVSGNIILASDLPSIREVLSGNESLFFESDNILSLKNMIEQVFDKKIDIISKVEGARSKINLFTWEKRAEDIIKFLNNNNNV